MLLYTTKSGVLCGNKNLIHRDPLGGCKHWPSGEMLRWGGREGGKEPFTGMGARLDVGGGEEDGASMKRRVLHFSTTTRRAGPSLPSHMTVRALLSA